MYQLCNHFKMRIFFSLSPAFLLCHCSDFSLSPTSSPATENTLGATMLLPQKFQNSRMTEPKIPPVIKWKQRSRWAFQESFFSGGKRLYRQNLVFSLVGLLRILWIVRTHVILSRWNVMVWVSVILNRIVYDSQWRFAELCRGLLSESKWVVIANWCYLLYLLTWLKNFKRCDVIQLVFHLLSLDVFGKDSNKGGEVCISALLLSLSINIH